MVCMAYCREKLWLSYFWIATILIATPHLTQSLITQIILQILFSISVMLQIMTYRVTCPGVRQHKLLGSSMHLAKLCDIMELTEAFHRHILHAFLNRRVLQYIITRNPKVFIHGIMYRWRDPIITTTVASWTHDTCQNLLSRCPARVGLAGVAFLLGYILHPRFWMSPLPQSGSAVNITMTARSVHVNLA